MLECWNADLRQIPIIPLFHPSIIPENAMRYLFLTILSIAISCSKQPTQGGEIIVAHFIFISCYFSILERYKTPKLFYLTPQAPDTFSLSGTVHLEGQEDHSRVTVALNLYFMSARRTCLSSKIVELLISIG